MSKSQWYPKKIFFFKVCAFSGSHWANELVPVQCAQSLHGNRRQTKEFQGARCSYMVGWLRTPNKPHPVTTRELLPCKREAIEQPRWKSGPLSEGLVGQGCHMRHGTGLGETGARLVGGQPAPAILFLTQCWRHRHVQPQPALYRGTKDLNSGPQVYTIGT